MKLKPCPFCGKKARLEKHMELRGDKHSVNCMNGRCVIYNSSRIYKSKRGAIAAWNRRAK